MTRPRRLILATSLLLSSVLLHHFFCRWVFGATHSSSVRVLAYRATDQTPGGETISMYGIVSRGVPGPVAGVFGVVVPLNMLLALAYLVVGWREESRAAAGRCIGCGHPLAGARRCPECGVEVGRP